jgi:hypothetical protein
MNHNTIKVREGNTGILYILNWEGNEERYIPNYDLNIARELLLEFQQLRDIEGNCIKDNYWMDGYNWYPTIINYLYSQVFFAYVKYKLIIDKIINNKLTVICENRGNFYNLVSLVTGIKDGNYIKKRIFNFLIRVNNNLIIRKYKTGLLFFKFTPDDFRTANIKKILDEQDIPYIEVIGPEKKLLLSNIFSRKAYYFYGGISFKNIFKDNKYLINSSDANKNYLFCQAIKKIELIISSFINEYKLHNITLNNTNYKVFYGIDDTQIVYPLLYACKKNNIRTITHQHGAAYNRLHASYVMEGINKDQYKWFDEIIVWGNYWKDHLLSISNVYSAEMFVIGSNLFNFTYRHNNKNNSFNRNILIPYEFLTNTYKVGRYITKLIDLGYNIYFKPRVDENVNDQIKSYCLSKEYEDKIKIVHEITPGFLNKIDIVAGTMTTLIYQLLPYHKIIWVLETEYRYLDDLVEDGYARKVRYEDLERLDESYFTRTEIEIDYFFSPLTLEETISKYVLNYSDKKISSNVFET